MTKYYLSKGLTGDWLCDEGFKYDGTFYYRFFPVRYYHGKRKHTPVTWMKIQIDLDQYTYDSRIMLTKDTIDSLYYTPYGCVEEYKYMVDKGVRKVMSNLCYQGIMTRGKAKKRYQGERERVDNHHVEDN